MSSITYIQKANGELCLCLDPCDLNKAICFDHCKTPTVEQVAHKFAHSHYFTKLDACHGYWSIILDKESSLLTTFNSPFGRYHFLHLPFGLVCSQDIFQKKMSYLSPFIPGLSTLTAPLHELLKKDTDFTWNCTYDATFQHVKDAIISDTTLRYFDLSLPMTIQVDASQVGFGAALLQNNKPVALTSKALTETECHYSNIEREMLTVIFRAQRFRT